MKRKTIASRFVAAGLALTSVAAQAGVFDLTPPIDPGPLSVNGADVRRGFVQPAGTGKLGSFVRLESSGGDSAEEAYNTRVDGIFDNSGGDPNNQEVRVGDIGIIDSNGTDPGGEVMRFVLDINEGGGPNSLLSLNEVQIFLTRTPNQPLVGDPNPTRPANGSLLNLGDLFLVYQMDGNENNRVDLDGSIHPGSGIADMFLDIPVAMLNAAFVTGGFLDDAAKNGAYLYLYSRFGTEEEPSGDTTGYAASSGFEEWAAIRGNPFGEQPCNPAVENCGGQEVPEPGALSLFAIGLGAAAVMARRRRKL